MDKVEGGLYDVTGNIIAFEEGELSDGEIVTLFQHLVDNGMAWTLQGSYGRAAHELINAGLVRLPGEKKVTVATKRNPHHVSD